jgi:EAL and modified HD-GYP domain-containing signal transduction protein
MLHVINSTASGIGRRVSSVHQALVLLGLPRLRSWLLLMVISDAAQATESQVSITMTRARACQIVSETARAGVPHAAFTVGLISGMAGMLGIPVRDLTERLPLADEVTRALNDGTGDLGAVLTAVMDYEQGDARAGDVFGPDVSLGRAYLSAMAWSLQTCETVLGTSAG